MKRIVIGFVIALLSQAFASPARADGASAPLQPFEQVLERAEKGDVEAEIDIGIRYQTGEGVARDVLKAIGWYRGPAEKGNAKAQFLLGTIYFNGAEGVRQNYAEALRWYRRVIAGCGLLRVPEMGRHKISSAPSTCAHSASGVTIGKR
ncbi:tetratricopeptide repeat protein [Ensifer sp. Root278]|uniref:tetratricopeptide repeat protein n=1 Tax=unclassified Ensifer TaxID=2633371 RepID=UPI00070C4FDE|nr:tetratricopeptide repeat protein [Ensifer sp. Root278]KRD71707.1 hypothetical protein ASE60_24205 [Ensifer sp. Root278]